MVDIWSSKLVRNNAGPEFPRCGEKTDFPSLGHNPSKMDTVRLWNGSNTQFPFRQYVDEAIPNGECDALCKQKSKPPAAPIK